MILIAFILGFIAGLLVSIIALVVAYLRAPRLPTPPVFMVGDSETATVPPIWTMDEWAMIGSELVQ